MQPLFYAALAFALGIALPGVPQAAVLALVCTGCARLLRRGRAVLLLAAVFCLGSVRGHRPQPAMDTAGWLGEERVTLTGTVRDDPTWRNEAPRFVLDTQAVEAGGHIWQRHLGVRVTVRPDARRDGSPWGSPLRAILAGTQLRLSGELHRPHHFLDPGVPDARRRDARNAIELAASVHSAQVVVLPGNGFNGPQRLRTGLRTRLIAALDAMFAQRTARRPATRPPSQAVLSAMLLGDTGQLDPATREDFETDGIYHVLVVAGLHVGILMLWLTRLGRWLRLSPLHAAGCALLLLAGYTWLIVGRTPTLRAVLMLAIYLGASAWYRQRQPLNAVGAAALLLLLARPGDLFDVGWQMSFTAAVLLAGVAAPWLAHTARPRLRATERLADTGYDEAFSPLLAQHRLELRMVATRLAWFWPPLGWRLFPALLRAAWRLYEVVAVALVLQLGFIPLMAVYFHRANPWSVVVNTLVVPWVALLLPLAWVLLLLVILAPPMAHAAGLLLTWAMRPVLLVAHGAAHWPGADWRVATPPLWAVAVFAGVAALWLWVAAERKGLVPQLRVWDGRRFAAATLLVAIWGGVLVAAPFPPRLPRGRLTLWFLDVGQGDAILVGLPDQRTLLVDAGPAGQSFDAGASIVAPALWSLGIRHLDAVVLSHAHNDHLGGMATVMHLFHPDEIWVSRTLPADPPTRAFLRDALADGGRLRALEAGERLQVGSVIAEVLLPMPDYRAGPSASNDDSLALRLRYGGQSMMLTGDTEAAGEEAELASGLSLRSQLLKIGHHGSRTSTTPAFLAAVAPQAAVISVGADNRYGHPSPQVLATLQAAGARVFRTDRDGAVEVQLDGNMLRVRLLEPASGSRD